MSILNAFKKQHPSPSSIGGPCSSSSFGSGLVSAAWAACPPFSGFVGATASNGQWGPEWQPEDTYGGDDEHILKPQDEANYPFFKKEMEELCPEIEINKSQGCYGAMQFIFYPNGKGAAEQEQADDDDFFARLNGYDNPVSVMMTGGDIIGTCLPDGRLTLCDEGGHNTNFIPHCIEDYRRYAKAMRIELDDRKEKQALRQKMEALSKKRDSKIRAALG